VSALEVEQPILLEDAVKTPQIHDKESEKEKA
jgi:hypothetical protein